MQKKDSKKIALIFVVVAMLALASCGGGGSSNSDPNAPDRDNTPQVLENVASGEAVFDGSGATVDYSHTADGYIMVKYEGDNPKIKVQIAFAGQEPYTYDLPGNTDFQAFPLSQGNGNYTVSVFLNVGGDKYSTAASQSFDVALTDEFAPFLRPNQYSNFNAQSAAVAKGAEVSKGSKGDVDTISDIFEFVTKNVDYDYEKAATVESGYLPNVDETLSTGKGICFDYASLMTAMMRSQRIPCKLVVGYAGEAYHAWISAYVEGTGWVDNIIEFDGAKWYFMDPTFVASGDKSDPNVVGDGTNYNPLYYY
jgi:hypothetical protein